MRDSITHCSCCGAFKPWCVCWGGMWTDAKTGEQRSRSCAPADHGRI